MPICTVRLWDRGARRDPFWCGEVRAETGTRVTHLGRALLSLFLSFFSDFFLIFSLAFLFILSQFSRDPHA
jgi:hypothetical protein